ncbi:hypothetical protein N7474_008083 [Penicillium riverlandense]|uniref:uncharacterized protein n=1 Tax=Penicillium riverlandense TaxID=1903569 RepID=UPI0025481ADE|nr:uncharacterized protein N7474_008083 [Penicillium riverlandense]KAJ5811782.1 hypothetical protein N7474_008083 [Penicillium riverlandense]
MQLNPAETEVVESIPSLSISCTGDEKATGDPLEYGKGSSDPSLPLEFTAGGNSDKINESLFFDYTEDLALGDIWNMDYDTTTGLPDSSLFGSTFLSPMFTTLDDKAIILSNHYFSDVCPINSCFDSHRNPFRSFVGDLMAASPLVYHSVMMMSASHICHRRKEMTTMALKHRNDAISYLKERSDFPGEASFEAILGSVLLGMTSAWQNPASLGLAHLRSARMLFREWCARPDNPHLTRSGSFLLGIMAYWEAMASFLTAESPNTLEYITAFCRQEHGNSAVYPNPWTGVSTTLFIYAAQAGALCRQNRAIHSLCASITSPTLQNEIHPKQINDAAELELKVLRYTSPTRNRIEDPGDSLTTIRHLECLAQIYRLTILLQLYITFPDLLRKKQDVTAPSLAMPLQPHKDTPMEVTIALAVSILNVISSVPESSGIKVLFTLPLLIAGSALQDVRKLNHEYNSTEHPECPEIIDEIMSLHCGDLMLLHWRSLVRHKLKSLHDLIGLDPILRAIQILEAVWLRADLLMPADENKEASFIHWMDVMAEERLESVFG